jgi:hypothetical protein
MWIIIVGVAAPIAAGAYLLFPQLLDGGGWKDWLVGAGIALGVSIGNVVAIKDLVRRRGLTDKAGTR